MYDNCGGIKTNVLNESCEEGLKKVNFPLYCNETYFPFNCRLPLSKRLRTRKMLIYRNYNVSFFTATLISSSNLITFYKSFRSKSWQLKEFPIKSVTTSSRSQAQTIVFTFWLCKTNAACLTI